MLFFLDFFPDKQQDNNMEMMIFIGKSKEGKREKENGEKVAKGVFSPLLSSLIWFMCI